jgi:hypothetical protein
MQNFACGGAGVPQAGQTASSAFPQDMQKRASVGFSVPQFWQTRAAISISGYGMRIMVRRA